MASFRQFQPSYFDRSVRSAIGVAWEAELGGNYLHSGARPVYCRMAVQTYGCNHVALEVTSIERAVRFYADLFGLKIRHQDEHHAFLYIGEHQFLALSRVEEMPRAHDGHFGLIVRDDAQVQEVKRKVVENYGLPIDPDFRCDFRDPFGNRVQVVDLHDESLVWLLPYRECQKADVVFSDDADQEDGWQ